MTRRGLKGGQGSCKPLETQQLGQNEETGSETAPSGPPVQLPDRRKLSQDPYPASTGFTPINKGFENAGFVAINVPQSVSTVLPGGENRLAAATSGNPVSTAPDNNGTGSGGLQDSQHAPKKRKRIRNKKWIKPTTILEGGGISISAEAHSTRAFSNLSISADQQEQTDPLSYERDTLAVHNITSATESHGRQRGVLPKTHKQSVDKATETTETHSVAPTSAGDKQIKVAAAAKRRSKRNKRKTAGDAAPTPEQQQSSKPLPDAPQEAGPPAQPSPSSALPNPARTEFDPSCTPVVPPKPTARYLAQAILPPRTLRHPQPILLVIDLNGTLLFRTRRDRKPRSLILRPHLAPFIDYIMAHFHVMIWSSSQPENVAAMCDSIFSPEQRARLVAMWGRDRLGLSPTQYRSKVQIYKELEKVWRDDAVAATFPGSGGPGLGERWSQRNTVLLDDSPLKAASEPYNIVEVPEFLGAKEEKGEGGALQAVREYLEALRWQADVSGFIRQRPFSVGSSE